MKTSNGIEVEIDISELEIGQMTETKQKSVIAS